MSDANVHPEIYGYLSDLIGRPWERRGLHCWRVVAQVESDLFGRTIPYSDKDMVNRKNLRALMGEEAGAHGWTEVATPEHGAVARMYRAGGNPADLEHAGVYFAIYSGMVLHSDHPHGVVLDTLLDLAARGWVPRWFVPKAAQKKTRKAKPA